MRIQLDWSSMLSNNWTWWLPSCSRNVFWVFFSHFVLLILNCLLEVLFCSLTATWCTYRFKVFFVFFSMLDIHIKCNRYFLLYVCSLLLNRNLSGSLAPELGQLSSLQILWVFTESLTHYIDILCIIFHFFVLEAT